MILNKTRHHRERYKVLCDDRGQGCYGDPDYYPTHNHVVVSGIDKGNGYQAYYSITYFLTQMDYIPYEAKRNLIKFLEEKGYDKYLKELKEKGKIS